MLTSEPLSALAGLRHGFFTRGGGVSQGLYASMNCGLGSGDDPGRVAENRGRCPDWHPGAGEKAWIFADEITIE